jgi:hypothetical protein
MHGGINLEECQINKLILGLTIFILLLSGCNKRDKSHQSTLITDIPIKGTEAITAEETVQLYFNYWQEKDSQGMDSLVIENKKGGNKELDSLNSISLESCVERTDKGNWDTLWFENPYDYTCVDVSFTINNKSGEAVTLSNGTYDWQYYLVKESEDSDWMIVMWGAKEM